MQQFSSLQEYFQGGKDEIPHDLQWFFEETALFFVGQIKTIGSMYGILTNIVC